MRISRVFVSVAVLLLLTACESTLRGVKQDAHEVARWTRGETGAQSAIGVAPKGYAGQNRKVLLKPPEDMTTTLPDGSAATWNRVGNTDRMIAAPIPVDYGAVSVFPVDSDMTVRPRRSAPVVVGGDDVSSYSAPSGPMPSADTSYQLVQQVFFSYGSSTVSAGDRRRLVDWARSIGAADAGSPAIVVGHASAGVKGVANAAKEGEINKIMGQKRAKAVAQVLKNAGIEATPISRGSEEPNLNPGGRMHADADSRVDVLMNVR